MRRMSLLLALFWLAGSPAWPAPETAASSGPLRITNGPYLQEPSQNGMTIMWRTNKKCLSHVEYWTGETTPSIAFSSTHGLRDANTLIHKVHVAGLKPGTTYRYRAVSREIVSLQPYKVAYGETVKSADAPFATLNAKKRAFSFIAFNDRHEKATTFTASLDSVRWDGVDLVVLNGDMLSDFQRESQILRAVIDPCVQAFATRIPFVYVRGNHETRGAMARMLMDYIAPQEQRYYYSFTHGPVHFVILDSGEDKEDASREYSGLVDFDRYRDAETDWLRREVRSAAFRKAPFRVVFIHMPPDPESDWHGQQEVNKKWMPILNAAGIDLMISAHTHRYARLAPGEVGNRFPIVIGGVNTTLRVDVTGRQLACRVTGLKGRTTDEWIVARRPRFPASLFGFSISSRNKTKE